MDEIMDFRRLYLEDLGLIKVFFQNNPLEEDKDTLQDREEEIEDDLRLNKFQYFGFVKDHDLIAFGKLRNEGDEAHFIGPFVLPEYRRKGIGKNIIEKIELHCQQKGTSRLNAYSFIDTKLAEEFLTNSGYKLESVDALGVNIYIKEFK